MTIPFYRKRSKPDGGPIFFDVRTTRGDDCFLTITESRKMVDDSGAVSYDRHKIFLYKEDFDKFAQELSETIGFIRGRLSSAPEIVSEKGE